MPIHFACKHCGQKLSVSSSKAGLRAKCPKCSQAITVPGKPLTTKTATTAKETSLSSTESPAKQPVPDAAARESAEVTTTVATSPEASNSEAPAISRSAPPPPPPLVESTFAFSEPEPAEHEASNFNGFPHASDDTEWVYANEDDTTSETELVDTNKLAIPRWILYAQGALIGIVALLSFLLGWLAGGAGSAPTRNGPNEPRPVAISGKISYRVESGEDYADEGAVVVVLPLGSKPDTNEKIAINGLRPQEALPPEDHRGLGLIRELGGGYGRSDGKGEFRVRLPDAGKFHILIISKQGRRKATAEISKSDLAQIGRYFVSALDLLGDRRYRWRSEDVYRDRRIILVMD